MPLSPGEFLGRYEVLSFLGESAGQVYQARERGLGRLVALHILPPGTLTDPLRATTSLNHPHIAAVLDAGTDRGIDYVAAESSEGVPLEGFIPAQGLPFQEVLKYGAQAAAALAAAHAAGIAHGSVSGRNLVVYPGGLLKVRNFAMPNGTAPPGESSDILALGAVLYRMATGRSVEPGEHAPPAPSLRPDLPPEVARAIHRCLRRDPARRFQSMADVRVVLEELEEDAAAGNLTAPSGRRSMRPWQWLTLAALGVAAVLAAWRLSPAPQSETGLTALPLTGYSGEEHSPSFSPDGAAVAFTWNGEKGDNFDIYVKPVGPGLPTRLTTNSALDRGPKWSPDGRTIAFLRDLEGSRTAVILIPARGGPERRIAEFYRNQGYFSGALDWTPDSKWIFVAGARAPGQARALFRVSADNGAFRQMTNPPPKAEGDVTPAVSPDGHTLAFLRVDGAAQEILLVPLGPQFEPRGQPSRLNTGRYTPTSVAWMPDADELLFAAGEGLESQLYRVPEAGSAEPHPLALSGMGALSPTVSPSGHRLAYVLQVQDTNIWRTALNDLSVPEKLVASSYREVFPQFSPDGQRIAYHSNQSGEVQIWTCDVQGAQPVQLTHLHGAMARNARWSPDGRELAFESNRAGAWQIYTIGDRGNGLRELTFGDAENTNASWSRGGQWVYFSSRRSGTMEVWKVPSGGGNAVQVTTDGGEAPLESPDGRTLYYIKGESRRTLWSRPLEGGAEALVFPSVYRVNYAVSRKGVYCTTAPGADGKSSIQVLDLASGDTAELARIEKPLDLGLALSPDGRYILHAQVDYHGVDLMIADGFR